MEIVRDEAEVTTGFVIQLNEVAQDKVLSLRARGLHQLVRSLPPGFRITADEIARNWCPEGRDAVRKAMNELVAVGLVSKEKHQDHRGHWQTRMRVYGKRQSTVNTKVSPTTDFQASAAGAELDSQETAGQPYDGFPGVGEPVVGNPVVGKPGAIDNKHTKTKNTPSVRVRNSRSARETKADGRTDGDSSVSEPAPSQPPRLAAVSDPAGAKEVPLSRGQELVAGEAIQADLARIDMRPGQRRQLATVVDRELARFSEGQVRHFLAVKAREADTATYLIKAFTLYSDEIYLATDPLEAAAQRLEDAALAEAMEADRCAEHPNAGRRADGTCSLCWSTAIAADRPAEPSGAQVPTDADSGGSAGEIDASTGSSVAAAELCVACETVPGSVREELPLRSRVCDQCWSAEKAAS